MQPINVFAIGSCRIHRPLRHLDKRGEISLLNRHNPLWFTHTSGAARQYLEVVTEKLKMPEDLHPYILEGCNPRGVEFDGKDQIQACDLVIVEVSTLKVNRARGWDLNAHRLWQAARKSDTSTITSEISEYISSSNEIIEDLHYIRNHSNKPIMVVDHLFYIGQSGKPFVGREQLTKILADAAQCHEFIFYPTRPAIELYGQEAAMEDSAHYRNDFIPVVADAMYPFIRAAAARTSAPRPDAKLIH